MNEKWTISKEFNFEMGHRVWSQKLDHAHLSLSTECACKHLHGHSYSIKVNLEAKHLDNSSMVTDFKNLNFVKEFLDSTLDHKFMLDVNDPNFDLITGVKAVSEPVINFTNLYDYIWDFNYFDDRTKTHIKSFVLVNFVPTSENICKYLKQHFQEKIGYIAKVSAVELWETKKSYCRYEDIKNEYIISKVSI